MTSPAPTACALGIDLGGTKIAAALVTPDGAIVSETVTPTGAADGAAAVIDRLADAIRAAQQTAPVPLTGVGIALPGPVDAIHGIALNSVNLGWRAVPLRAELQRRGIDVPIMLQNDVKAGAIGEGQFGAAVGISDYVYLAIGTGLGGAAVSGGRLIDGAHGWAMEIGHVVVDPAGRRCPCGLTGCAETIVSGVGIMSAMRQYGATDPAWAATPITVPAALDAARHGDPIAVRAFAEAADALGVVMAWCALMLNPARIVIGGGLGLAARDLLFDRAIAKLHQHAHAGALAGLTIVPAAAPSTALGAAALVWRG